jgi:hypothetical protein
MGLQGARRCLSASCRHLLGRVCLVAKPHCPPRGCWSEKLTPRPALTVPATSPPPPPPRRAPPRRYKPQSSPKGGRLWSPKSMKASPRALSVMDLIANLEHFDAEGGFVCKRPAPHHRRRQGEHVGVLSAPKEVSFVLPTSSCHPQGRCPLTVVLYGWCSHRPGAFGGTRSRRVLLLGGLSLCVCASKRASPSPPKAWVEQDAGWGGQVFARKAPRRRRRRRRRRRSGRCKWSRRSSPLLIESRSGSAIGGVCNPSPSQALASCNRTVAALL